jgi:thioredoxin 1
MSDNVLVITDSNFKSEVLESDIPVLVDFWAAWCGPCKMLAPTIQELANQYQGQLRVGKLDADQNPDSCTEYGVSGLPTCILFKNGQIVAKVVGMAAKPKFVAAIDAALKT